MEYDKNILYFSDALKNKKDNKAWDTTLSAKLVKSKRPVKIQKILFITFIALALLAAIIVPCALLLPKKGSF